MQCEVFIQAGFFKNFETFWGICYKVDRKSLYTQNLQLLKVLKLHLRRMVIRLNGKKWFFLSAEFFLSNCISMERQINFEKSFFGKSTGDPYDAAI